MKDLDALEKERLRTYDRVLIVEPVEGQNVKTNTGLIDNRLFKGGNRIHAIKEINTDLWYFRYEQGGLPEPLKQRFTSFQKLMTFATDYFNKRGLRITGVEDI